MMYIDEYRTMLDPDRGITIQRSRSHYIPKDRFFAIKSPGVVAEVFNEMFDTSSLPEEHIWALALNIRGHAIGVFEIAHGSTGRCFIEEKDIFKRLLVANADSFIVVHNHPSKDVTPSSSDREVAKSLSRNGRFLGIPMLDFLILGDDNVYFSFGGEGLLES